MVVDKVQQMDFPDTDAFNEKDRIIRKCWYGEFKSMGELRDAVESLGYRAHETAAGGMTSEFFEARRAECKRLMENRILDAMKVSEEPSSPAVDSSTVNSSAADSPTIDSSAVESSAVDPQAVLAV